VQPWLKALDNATLRKTLQARGEDIGRRYRGRFVEYDFNNEMMHGNYYTDRLGADITREMAGWVIAQDPNAKLFVNDYDILTGNRLADSVAHVRRLQSRGVPIAGLGVQGHLHGDSFDPVALQHALDELAQFKLPVRVTEFTFPGQRSKYIKQRDALLSPDEEAAKAKAIVDYYRICFAHPTVTGIIMWGFWAGADWIPQASLFRRDWTPTPAAQAFHDLIFKEWWTRWDGRADASGRVEVPAFFGTHRVTSGGKTVTVELRKQDGVAEVKLN
jgi:endo-1,4-beta-xylanase